MADNKHRPHPDYPFFLFDPEGDGTTYWRTREARDEQAAKAIREYIYPGEGAWSEEVTGVCCGEVTHIAAMVDREDKPTDMTPEELEEEGWDAEADYRCYYRPLPIAELRAAKNEQD